MKRLLILGLLALSGSVLAQTPCLKIADNKAHVCWTAPSTNEDSTPIVMPITYTVQVLAPGTTVWAQAVAGISALDWISGVLTPGTYKYRVLAVVNGATSAASASGDKIVPNPIPGSPGGVVVAQVVIEIPYSPVLSARTPGYVMGLASVGTPCDQTIVYNFRGRAYRRPLIWTPMTGVSSLADVVAPCKS